MKGLPTEEVTRLVLEEINKIRNVMELPPVYSILKGKKGKSKLCPIARTIAHESIYYVLVGADHISAVRPLFKYTCLVPLHIKYFIRMFDDGMYPLLELREHILCSCGKRNA